jgi:hypothetical protein
MPGPTQLLVNTSWQHQPAGNSPCTTLPQAGKGVGSPQATCPGPAFTLHQNSAFRPYASKAAPGVAAAGAVPRCSAPAATLQRFTSHPSLLPATPVVERPHPLRQPSYSASSSQQSAGKGLKRKEREGISGGSPASANPQQHQPPPKVPRLAAPILQTAGTACTPAVSSPLPADVAWATRVYTQQYQLRLLGVKSGRGAMLLPLALAILKAHLLQTQQAQ